MMLNDVVISIKIQVMKNSLLLIAVFCSLFSSKAQESKTVVDSINRGITQQVCPQGIVQFINTEIFKTKAVLLVFNESLHPLGRYEFFDAGARVQYLHIPMRMNRCTLLYIDTGLHLFHTMYQQLKEPVYYEQGKIYLARLFSRASWPFGGISVIKKNEIGEAVEYAAVLFEYINNARAIELYNKMNKKEVLINEK
jgi:hypothetical protein